MNNISNNAQIGARIQESRKAACISQATLAERIDVSTQYISDLERGIAGASVQTIIKLCNELNISTDYILRGTDPAQFDTPKSLLYKVQQLSPTHKKLVEKALELIIDALNSK